MKIGVLLPQASDLSLLLRAKRLSQRIGEQVDEKGESWSAAIGLPEPRESRWRNIERELRSDNPHTMIRHLKWEPVPVDNARRMIAKIPADLDLDGIEQVTIPRDWGWNFQDCDALVVFADPGLGAILPLRPTIFYCVDLASRIVPEAFATSIEDAYWNRQTDAFRMWRQAAVATADPAVADDLVSYAGVRRSHVALVENLLAPPSSLRATPKTARDQGMLAWPMQPSPLHDLENAVRGLQIYQAEGGSLRPTIIRHDGALGREDEYPYGLPDEQAEFFYALPSQTAGSERELLRILARAEAIWCSRMAGGEGEAAFLAAETGSIFFGADYATNRWATEAAGGSAAFYPLGEPLAIADALHQLEQGGLTRPRKPRKAKAETVERQDIVSLIERAVGQRDGV